MSAAATEQRLTELEIKASFSEDLLDRLNDVIVRQQHQIDELSRTVAALRQQIEQLPAPGFRSLRDELPPHF
ncbi:SlyX family protein [Piscinibacter sakaiensis]|uniref:SlyX family protein n=1 Tax=Piscinibacter sakaiensis TaxID=1547922 RepID=UPI003AB065EE